MAELASTAICAFVESAAVSPDPEAKPVAGSGTAPRAATAGWNLSYAPRRTVLVADGYGNVMHSGISLDSLSSTTNTDCGNF